MLDAGTRGLDQTVVAICVDCRVCSLYVEFEMLQKHLSGTYFPRFHLATFVGIERKLWVYTRESSALYIAHVIIIYKVCNI